MPRVRFFKCRLDTVSFLLLLFTIARAAVVCLSTPVAAYANNYDFVRQSSCVGVWQDYGGKEKTLNNPERPVDNLIFDGDVRPDICMNSIDNAVPWIAAHVAGRGSHISLRAIGFIKVVLLTGVLLVLFMQPVPPLARLAIMVAACILFGDIAVLSYFDTLYLDASVILFCFASVSAAVGIWCRSRPPTWLTLIGFLSMVTVLTCTKQQYAPFAIFIGCIGLLGLLICWRAKRLCGFGLAGLILVQISYFTLFLSANDHTYQIQKANLSDTFLEAVLPSAPDKSRALTLVGLPQDCLPAIGLNWYEPRVQRGDLCPEVFRIHRSNLLPLFAAYPETFAWPLLHAAAFNRPFYLPTIGHFERASDVGRLRFRLATATSLSTWMAAPSDTVYCALVIVLSLLGPIGLLIAVRSAVRTRSRLSASGLAWLIVGCGGTLAFYSVGSAVFGDGYGDLQRHCVGILIASAFLIGGLTLASSAYVATSS